MNAELCAADDFRDFQATSMTLTKGNVIGSKRG